MDLKELRRQRRSRFMAGLMPYMGYIIQSGLAMLLILLLVVFSAWYTSLLRDIPEGLPIRWIMLVFMLPAAALSGFRTYLQTPDTIFLLPQEHQMKHYFAPSWISGNVWKLLRLAFVLVTLWPLYIRTETSHRALLATLLLMALVKLLASFGLWRELAMVSRPASAAYSLLRWAVCGLMIAAWFWQPPLRALLFIAVLAVAYYAALAVPARHTVPWERLIAREREQGDRALLVLGWFVDVPGRGQRVYARRYLSRLGNRIPWRRTEAYRFLLTKSFARGDVFGIVLRIAVLGMFLVGWNRESYAGSGIYVFFLLILGIQLSTLRRLHSGSFWLTVYPLPEGSKGRNTVKLAFRIHLVLALALGLPLLAALPQRPLQVLGTLAVGILAVYWMKNRMAGKVAGPADDDDL
ncbi:ABC transporter permease [Paenibacillus sp. NFR01]|uniref:ABC transporter permease n=1 Tax=Paenibacillus sp. NFR01 TaxID=1566279 RepID=UPI0008CA2577|nr:ABC transporter permease [Paenibacillus sp. NFR01]SEU18935.1 ABC-2 type transport system permease protein [Paenibacillus sp. NFR01]